MATDKQGTITLNKGPSGAPIPEEDPRARAAKRLAELQGHWGGETPPDADTEDMFWAPPAPEGWTYEWKCFQVSGKEDPSRWTVIESVGWSPVPLSRHPEMMPSTWAGNTIDNRGQRLMEIPTVIVEKLRARDRWKANKQVSDKEDSLKGVGPGEFERQKSTGESLVKIRKSYEPMEIPK